MNDRLELKKASLQKIGEDVLLTQYKSGFKISEADAKEIDGAHLTMSQGNDVFIIADFTATDVSFEKSAEAYFVKKGKMIPYTKGIAIVTNKKSSFFDKLFATAKKTLCPTKEFDSMSAAVAWIDEIRD
ncbi:MAG: hypothetical protein WDZ35_01660 [Crocinitomicaceae bacterium]